VRTGDLIVRQIGPETVVYDRRTHRAHCLGPLAAAVWRSWAGRRSAADIARHLAATRGEPIGEIAVGVALRRLERAGLVARRARQAAGGASGDRAAPTGPARREALRAVATITGLAVLSIATRSPAQAAATCLARGSRCTESRQCCERCCQAVSNICTGGGPCIVP
jgi:hypothetical protein